MATGSSWTDAKAAELSSPTAVLAAMAARGESGGEPCGGIFALAHHDARRRRVVVESDRFGALPVYYRELGAGAWAVATELKFLAVPGQERVDDEGFAQLMGMGHLPGTRTLLAGVRRLPAHHRLILDTRGCRVELLPEPGTPRNRRVDAAALEEFDALVQRSLGRFASATDRWTVSLSAGLDSRLVAGAAARLSPELRGFVVGEPGVSEVRVTQRLADHLDIPLHVHTIDGRRLPDWFAAAVWHTEGRTLPNHMHYVGANLMGDLPGKVILHGLIGEGIIGGYGDDPSLLDASPEHLREACRNEAYEILFWPGTVVQRLFNPERREAIRGARGAWAEEIMEQMDFRGTYGEFVEIKFRMRAVSLTVPNLLSQILPWQDVASPFLDKDIFAFANTFDAHDLVGRALQIRWAETHMPHLTEIPRLKDGVLIPVRGGIPDAYDKGVRRINRHAKWKYWACRASKGRINLPHRGSFPFYGQWFRRWPHVRQYVEDIVLSEQCLDRGLWQREGLVELVRSLREGRNTWSALGTVLLAEVFLRQFVDGTDRPEDPAHPRI